MVINEEFNFSYEMPEGYVEVPRSDYEKYNIDPSTIFVLLDGDNKASISLNRDDDAFDQEEYEEIIELNSKNLKNVGMDILSTEPTSLLSPSQYKVYLTKAEFRSLKFGIYFLVIRNTVCAISVEMKDDEITTVVESLIESIKVL